MRCDKTKDTGGLIARKERQQIPPHFNRLTLPIFECVNYIITYDIITHCPQILIQLIVLMIIFLSNLIITAP